MNPATFAKQKHPIFILGILQRSGTNYLNNLLLLHPDVQPPGMVWEDFHLAHADHLAHYVEATQRHWNDEWSEAVNHSLGHKALLAHLGKSIVDFMEDQHGACVDTGLFPPAAPTPVRLVTATPSVNNLDLFFDIFPQGAPIILVRDGRALVESGVRSFGWDYDEAMYQWAAKARDILAFCKEPKHQGKYFLVRYRDLYTHNREMMTKILDFLGLDMARFDFDAASNLGVMGSSEVVAKKGGLHWKEVPKPRDFEPLARARSWGPQLKCRFAWIAGKEMRALGFTLDDQPVLPVWNALLDHLYGLEIKLKRIYPKAAKWILRWRMHLLHAPQQNVPDAPPE